MPAFAKVERHLAAPHPYLNRGDEEFICSIVARAEDVPPLNHVPIHGDFQLCNLLLAEKDSLVVINFERSEPVPAIRGLVRLSNAWATQPRRLPVRLRPRTRPRRRRMLRHRLDALAGIQHGATHADSETPQRGHRALARLRAEDGGRGPATPKIPSRSNPGSTSTGHTPQRPTPHPSEACVPDDTQQPTTPVPSTATGDEPQEHHMHLLPRYYRQVEAGRKTIEVRAATPQKRAVAVGDTIVFHDRDTGRELDIIVQRITRYPSFDDLLSSEDPARIDPDGPLEELLATLRSIYPPAKEALGVLALEFDHRPARPGRRMPMTPTQYARTVPHHTVYGCLYIRDESDRPIQLRSVYGSRLWHFPGGNLDVPGEDPLQTARRETVEETSLNLGQDTPTLLLTHFLHAGPHLPLNKVGLIFDGGRLTAEHLARIRLDPAEHDMWAVHDLTNWQKLMTPRAFARLDAIEQARRGDGPAYLITRT
ncbi:NUDIX domain-containing protein [Streptomyces sp. NPDC002306]